MIVLKMVKKRVALLASAAVFLSSGTALAQDIAALEELGKRVFFDNISSPKRQGCHTCHEAANGWTGAVAGINKNGVAIPGANPRAVGQRKPPSNAYASFSPVFGETPKTVTVPLISPVLACALGIMPFCTGGTFWDGRAEGRAPLVAPPTFTGAGATAHVGTEIFNGNAALVAAYGPFIGPLADQALGPFPNDVEQNVPDGGDHGLPGAEAVCLHVKSAQYAELYTKAWGEPINCADPAIGFKRVALAISSWQHSSEVNSFSSRRDQGNKVLDAQGNLVLALPFSNLTPEENLGHDLFYGRNDSGLNPGLKNASCARCHNSHNSTFLGAVLGSKGDEPNQVYSDFAYHHIGVPANWEAENFDPDNGDAGILGHADPSAVFDSANPNATPLAGHYKTPTLRNVDKRRGNGFTKAYMHNGYFKSLEQVVHFYNTSILLRDDVNCPPGTTADEAMERGCWPAAEFDTPNQAGLLGLIGNLRLTAEEEAALVAYMKTLTDTVTPTQPLPYMGN
ncbi:cytochrome c peroxidase [Polyangium sp. y55x31]|uniref:cytochrome-c peroxidase n=1 Tax=Polyangium sp. y55x31 TaxID=3042688 RepID=UPI0024825C77|nr:cytochrome c peroxidase [Polyangium sp. y55x31]MDI1481723.1 cytochrome c peroxidase [Polyangium sp. y55x31]